MSSLTICKSTYPTNNGQAVCFRLFRDGEPLNVFALSERKANELLATKWRGMFGATPAAKPAPTATPKPAPVAPKADAEPNRITRLFEKLAEQQEALELIVNRQGEIIGKLGELDKRVSALEEHLTAPRN